jgi:hypothetical protein
VKLVPARKASPRTARKIIVFDSETWNALSALARDGIYDLQELADEASAACSGSTAGR